MTTHRTPAGGTVRQLLNLSTAHLPQHLRTPAGWTPPRGVVAHATEVGFLLWVPDNPDESAQATTDPCPTWC